MKTAYLAMEWVYEKEIPHLEIIGIFSTKEKVIKECIGENYFYGEFEIDNACHKKGVQWPTKDAFPIKQEA